MRRTGARLARCRRTATAGSVSVAVVLGAVALAPASRAQEAAEGQLGSGTAKATAVVAKVAPGVGSLELAMDQGIAVSEITNALAQSQAQAADLGLIGTSLTAEGCGDAVLKPEDLPQPIRVDNRGGDASEAADEVPAGPAGGAGRLRVEALTTPAARASATVANVGEAGALRVGGGEAVALTEVDPGRSRRAIATVDANLDIGGVLQLHGMRWTAVHRTGEGAVAEGSFEVAGASAGGLPLPIDDLEVLQDGINDALAETGITLELPRVERLTEPTDLVRVTPLRVRIDRSPLARTVLGPVLDASRTGREQMFDTLSEAICELGSVLFVGDVLLSVVAGTGFLSLDLGGVEAMTGDLVLTNPFGDLPDAFLSEPPPVDVAAAGGDVAADGGDPPSGPPPDAAAGPPATGAAPTGPTDEAMAPQPVAATGPLERLCESVHPFSWPSCSQGAAVPLGVIGLAVTAAMAALDLQVQRRRLALQGVAA